MKIKKACFLTENEIETFITANVLHAIDKKLLSEDFDSIEFKVTTEPNRFIVSLSTKQTPEEKLSGCVPAHLAGCDIPKTAEDYKCHLRHMMGATMKILDDLSKLHPKEEKPPVLTVIKGGLNG